MTAFGVLSHNHLLLVMLAWLYGVQWEFSEEEKELLPLTIQGRLDLAACKDLENLKELYDLSQLGMWLEVLGWQIMVEEPHACARCGGRLRVP